MFEEKNEAKRGPSLAIDLHGLSVKKAKEKVAEAFQDAQEKKADRLTIVTGIGNHINKDGSRGVLFNALPKWLRDPSLNVAIREVKQDMGAYEIQFNFTDPLQEHMVDKATQEIEASLTAEQKTWLMNSHKEKAEQGDIDSQIVLGWSYLLGRCGVKQDINKALSWLIKASEKDVNVQLWLGELYSSNDFPMKNYKKARKYFLKAAKQNHPVAFSRLAEMYFLGRGVIKNDTKAINHLIRAINLGEPTAAYNLGNIYFWGIDGKPETIDETLAAQYYTIAAKAGIVDAQVTLAKQHFFAWGIAQDDSQAFFWFEKAALQNDPIALYYVARCYAEGRGVNLDLYAAATWHEKSAAAGDQDAQHAVASGYLTGMVYTKDTQKGLDILYSLAEKGHRNSLFLLGKVLLMEDGSYQDKPAGIAFIKKAAELGQLEAQELLSDLDLLNTYGLMDKIQALYCLRQAAAEKNPEALYQLASLLEKMNLDQPTQESIDYLIEAADLGYPEAQSDLAALYIKGCPLLAKNTVKAFEYFQKAAEQDDVKAMVGLGCFYLEGIDIAPDKKIAKMFFEKAARKGNIAARHNLIFLLLPTNEEEKFSEELIDWLKLAAEDNDADSQYMLGRYYCLTNNWQDGSCWLKRAASLGHESALDFLEEHESALGFLEEFKSKEKSSDEELMDWLELTAKNNDKESQYVLGKYYFLTGNRQDGFHWLEQAASQGHKNALDFLKEIESSDFKDMISHTADTTIHREYEEKDPRSSASNIGLFRDTKMKTLLKKYNLPDSTLPSLFEEENESKKGPSMAIDLHGLSVKEAKERVAKTFQDAQERKANDLTIVTGIGNHINKNGSRGVLFKALPKWLQDPNLNAAIKEVKQDMGAYEIQFNFSDSSERHIDKATQGIELLLSMIGPEVLFAKLEEKAQQGDTETQAMLGLSYLLGRFGVEQDIDKGLSWLIKASEKDVNVQVWVGEIYSSNDFPIKNYKKSREYFFKAAKENHPTALLHLGKMYFLGRGIVKKTNKAINYLTRAADLGESAAAGSLGDIYFWGIDGKQETRNSALAAKYYTIAAKAGRVDAQVALAKQYFFAWGIEQDDSQAFFWFKEAALQNNAVALYYVGRCYQAGRGVSSDLHEAAAWYEKSAAAGDQDGQFEVANGYLDGVVYTKDFEKGLDILYSLAEKNHANSLCLLGMILMRNGPYQDKSAAIAFIKKAAELDQIEAQKLLSSLYLLDGYDMVDKAQALYWLRQAAAQKDTEALYQLAVLLEEINADQPTQEAIDCLGEAADLGYPQAQSYLAVLYSKGCPCLAKNPAKAFEYFQKAAGQDDVDAMAGLGYSYLNGTGIEPDKQMAKMYFDKAARKGDKIARKNLIFLLQPINREDEFSEELIYWLKLAAEDNDKDSQFILGSYLFKEYSTWQEGFHWIEQAALQGHNSALDFLEKIESSDFKDMVSHRAPISIDATTHRGREEKDSRSSASNIGLFGNAKIKALLKKYNLSDNTQPSLEKGLRNAALNNQYNDLKIFIQLVENINTQDSNPNVRRTALHWAAIKGHDDCCQLLLESGADYNIADATGETALEYLKPTLIEGINKIHPPNLQGNQEQINTAQEDEQTSSIGWSNYCSLM